MQVQESEVLGALAVLFGAQTDPNQRREANKWLEEFQKTSGAWQVCDAIINNNTQPIDARLFAAQTFRQKVEYDLLQLPESAHENLRDSLLKLLVEYRNGPKSLYTQLSIALADLAIQMNKWKGNY